MTISSNSGSSGSSVFGQQTPTAQDIETSAWTQINKAALGIVSDSIDQVFTQMSPRYQEGGYLGGFGYKSSEDRPLLDHPIETLRRSQNPPETTSNEWKTTYNQMINQLPSDMQARFRQQANLPLEERDPAFNSLDNLFTGGAKFITKAVALSQPESPNSLPEMRTSLNRLLPYLALKNTLSQGSEITESATNTLQAMGRNNRHFDGLTALLNDLKTHLSSIEDLDSSFAKTGYSGEISQNTKNTLGQVAERFHTLHAQLQRTNLGDELQILDPLLKALSASTAALSLPNTGSASLYLGLTLATTGLNSKSSTALVGPSLNTISNEISSAILSSMMPKASFAGKQLLHMSTTAAFTLMIGLASHSAQTGTGPWPPNSPTNKSDKLSDFNLALLFANSSNTINDTFKDLIETSGGNAKAQNNGGPILGQLASLLMLVSATRESPHTLSPLIETQSKYLEQGVNSAKNALEDEELSTSQMQIDEKTALSNIAVKQSQIALEQKNSDAFIASYSSLLESMGHSLDNLGSDIDTIRTATTHIAAHIDSQSSDQPVTGIQHIA